jgi:glutaredoxin 3
LLTELQETIDYEVEFIDLDLLPGGDGFLIQNHLKELTGQRTVPNIFIGQEHCGGNSDLEQLSAVGKLEIMLLEASGATEL